MSASWYDCARDYIRMILDQTLPAELPFEERVKAVRAAYPWGQRAMHPYKQWCKAQREYLARFKKSDAAIPEGHLSPLERMMRRAQR